MDNNDLSSMIQKIMQNPEFAGMVSELRGEDGKKSTEDITGEMMAHLPDVLAMVAPMLGNSTSASSEIPDAPENSVKEPDDKTKPTAPSEILPKKYDKAKAEKLLYAIKPYLSTSRCEIIDKCVSVMQLSDVMGALQGLDGLKKQGNHNGKGGK